MFRPKRVDQKIRFSPRRINDEIPMPIGIKLENSSNCYFDNLTFRNISTPILDIGGKGNRYRNIRAF